MACVIAVPGMTGVDVTEVAPGLTGWRCPWASTASPTVSAYLLRRGDGRRHARRLRHRRRADPRRRPRPGRHRRRWRRRCAPCGSAFERIERLVITHAHIDHFGLAGEVVRRSGGELWMHRSTELDLAKYDDPDEAVDRRS